MTQPVQTGAPVVPARSSLNVRSIISIAETIAFIVATVLQAMGYSSDAIITALAGAAAHGINHPSGGSPV